MITNFKDNFSKHADIYAKYRPVYPIELFQFLSSLVDCRHLAWDCGTGNGQSAVQLTNCFSDVYASDPSEEQIKNALHHPQIVYKIEKAEQSSLPSLSVDLITIAQALHWFDFETYYQEVNRVLKENGIIAVISYNNPAVSKNVDALIDHLHDVILDDFWQAENRLVEKGYDNIPFPFHPVQTPDFKIEKRLSFDDFIGHITTWSAVQRYMAAHNSNPISIIEEDLKNEWDLGESKKVTTWHLTLKVGRKISL